MIISIGLIVLLQTCDKLSNAQYVCNGCPKRTQCSLEKSLYDPFLAQKEYEAVRSESRLGICITEDEAIALDKVISHLVMKGQSIHHICTNNTSYCPIVQIDSVEGKKGGKVFLTIHFVRTEFMLAYIRDRNTAHSVYEVFEKLYWLLFPDDFMNSL